MIHCQAVRVDSLLNHFPGHSGIGLYDAFRKNTMTGMIYKDPQSWLATQPWFMDFMHGYFLALGLPSSVIKDGFMEHVQKNVGPPSYKLVYETH